MKKVTQWKRRGSHFFGMRPKTELTTYGGRGGNKVISSALESPFSDAKVSEDGFLTCKEEKHEEESTMARQLPWNRYEVALLLDAYLQIQKEAQKGKEILADLSKNLRERALRLGYTIDETFRNENGMSIQYQRMKFLMTNSAYGFEGPIPRCFHEVVDIYNRDWNWYQMILNKAKKDAGLKVGKKEKKAPIIVVDGVRVDAGASDKHAEPVKKPPPVPVIKHEPVIREPRTSENASEISIVDRLHLAPALQRKLEEEGVHTVKALQHFLADYKENYTIDFKDWQDANDKLQAYLRDGSFPSAAFRRETQAVPAGNEAEVEPETDESLPRSMRLLSEEDFGRIPAYAQKWNIYRLDLPFEMYAKLCKVNVHTVKELYDYFAVHTIHDGFSKDDWAQLHLKLLTYRKQFVKEQISVVKAQPKAEEKGPEPLVTAEPLEAYGRNEKEDKPAQLTCDLAEKRDYQGYQPLSFCYFGDETQVSGWRDMYVKCCKTLYEDYPKIFQRLAAASRKQPGPSYVGNSFETRYMHDGVSIGGIWHVETKIKPKQMMGILRAILKNSDVDYENLTFTFLASQEVIEPKKVEHAAHAMSEGDAAAPVGETPKDTPDIKAEEPAASEKDKLIQVLREKFPDGVRQQNLAMKQYKARYEEMFGEALLIENTILLEKLRDIGDVRADGRIYARASGAERGILEDIAKDLMRLLDESATSLYWPCIYEHYRNEFSQLSIFTEDVMRSELAPLFSSDYVCGEVISRRWETQNRGEEISRLVTGAPVAISLTSIQEKIWYWPPDMVKKFLDGVPGIIKARDLYFYEPNVSLSDTEKQRLRDALLEDMSQKQFIPNARLREILEESCPGVAMDMSSLDDALLRKVLVMLYPADFSEKAKGLFPSGNTKSGREQIQEYCRAHTRLSTSDVKMFAKQRGILGNLFNYVMDEMVRVSPGEWIRRDCVHFRGQEAHIIQKIGQQMGKKSCVPLEDFGLFLSFPDIGIPWNSYVLESFLYKNDAVTCPFSLMQANGGVCDSGVYGAVVKKGYAIDSYDDVLIELLSRSADWQTEQEALDFIVAHKLQVLRKMKQIGTIVKQAKVKRAQLVTANSRS